jgi:uncharacterized membrane protein YbhN (UPF0104 family)
MKKIIKIIGNILAVLSIVFVIYTLSKMDIQFQSIQSPGSVAAAMLAAILASVCAVYLLAVAWTRTVSYFARGKLGRREGINVYVRANIGKYLPGNVMHYVERNVYMVGSGLEQFEIALSTCAEIAGQLVAAVLVGVLLSWETLLAVFRKLISMEMILAVAIVIILLLMLAIIFIWKVSYIRTVFDKIWNFAFIKLFFLNLLIYIAVVLLLGSALVLLCCPLNGTILEISNIRLVLSAYTVAWVAGFVVPGAPGGIGVREFVLQFVTAGSTLGEVILLAAVFHRVATILGDVCSYLVEVKRKKGTGK